VVSVQFVKGLRLYVQLICCVLRPNIQHSIRQSCGCLHVCVSIWCAAAVPLQVRTAGYGSPMVFNCQMGAGRTTTGTVIGGLLSMYGSGNPAAVLPPAGQSGGGSLSLGGGGSSAAVAAAVGVPPLPPPISTTTASGAQGSGRGPAGGAGGASGALVAGLNEDQSRDILREEMAGDSPRCSGKIKAFMCLCSRGAAVPGHGCFYCSSKPFRMPFALALCSHPNAYIV